MNGAAKHPAIRTRATNPSKKDMINPTVQALRPTRLGWFSSKGGFRTHQLTSRKRRREWSNAPKKSAEAPSVP